jgi:hypothetical protein
VISLFKIHMELVKKKQKNLCRSMRDKSKQCSGKVSSTKKY